MYSAVFDLSEFQNYRGGIVTYLLSKLGWGITGEKDWRSDNRLKQLLNLNNYIKKEFPPVFITVENMKTFAKQACDFNEKLKKNNIPTQTSFFNEDNKVGHGYQLNMGTTTSREAVKNTLLFLEKRND